MTPVRRMGRNLAFKVLTELVSRVLSFVFYIVLARWLGEEPFGVFSLLYSVTSIVVFLVDPGLNLSMIRDAPRRQEYLPEKAGAILGLKIVMSALTAAICVFYGMAAGYPAGMIVLLFLMGAQMCFYALLEFAGAIFQSREEMQVETFLMGSGKLAVTCVAIGAVAAGGGLPAVLIMMTLAQGAAAAWALGWVSRKGAPLKITLKPGEWGELLKSSVPLAAVTFFTISYYRIDVAIAPFLGIGLKNIGLYSAGVKILDVWLAAPTLAVAAVFPTLSAMAQRDAGLFEKWMTMVITALGAAGIAVAAVTVWFAADIIRIVFGGNFSHAAAPLAWLGAAAAFMFVRHGLAQGLILAGRLRPVVWITMAALPLNMALNAAMAPVWGIDGMAAAKLLTDLGVAAAAGIVWFTGRGSGRVGREKKSS